MHQGSCTCNRQWAGQLPIVCHTYGCWENASEHATTSHSSLPARGDPTALVRGKQPPLLSAVQNCIRCGHLSASIQCVTHRCNERSIHAQGFCLNPATGSACKQQGPAARKHAHTQARKRQYSTCCLCHSTQNVARPPKK